MRSSNPTTRRRRLPVMSDTTITMYSTTWCGYCRRLKSQLDREGIAYTEVDIESHPEAANFVMQVNNGNQTVPTVLFPDGSAATNPDRVGAALPLSYSGARNAETWRLRRENPTYFSRVLGAAGAAVPGG